MKKYLLILLICVIPLAMADEFKFEPSTPGTTPVIQDWVQPQPILAPEPVWKGLERMTAAERENSSIELILEPNASGQALQMARSIENLWNNGSFEQALALFPTLGMLTDISEMAIGNVWRTPVPTSEPEWGADVRVGNRDSIFINVLDIHRVSSNLFAVMLYQQGSQYQWTINISLNGGSNWSETYQWWANYQMNSLSATVAANHCYVAFGRGSSQDQAFLARYRASDGQQDTFPGGATWVTAFTTTSPEQITEVAITSNQDFFNNRLYYLAITNQNNLLYYWDDVNAVSWTEVVTGITNADRGLDACCNEGYADYFLLTSYYDTGNTVHVAGRASTLRISSECGSAANQRGR